MVEILSDFNEDILNIFDKFQTTKKKKEMNLPLTNNETELIERIEQEIQELNDSFNQAIGRVNNSSSDEDIKRHLNQAKSFSKGIKDRSLIREDVIKEALGRL